MILFLNQLLTWVPNLLDALANFWIDLLDFLIAIFPSSPDFVADLITGMGSFLTVLASYNWLLPVSEIFTILVFFLDLLIVFIVLLFFYFVIQLGIKIAQVIRG